MILSSTEMKPKESGFWQYMINCDRKEGFPPVLKSPEIHLLIFKAPQKSPEIGLRCCAEKVMKF